MKVLDSFDFEQNRGRKASYDWDTIFDGQTREMVASDDFTCKPKSLIHSIKQKAKALNRKVSVCTNNGNVIVKAE